MSLTVVNDKNARIFVIDCSQWRICMHKCHWLVVNDKYARIFVIDLCHWLGLYYDRIVRTKTLGFPDFEWKQQLTPPQVDQTIESLSRFAASLARNSIENSAFSSFCILSPLLFLDFCIFQFTPETQIPSPTTQPWTWYMNNDDMIRQLSIILKWCYVV